MATVSQGNDVSNVAFLSACAVTCTFAQYNTIQINIYMKYSSFHYYDSKWLNNTCIHWRYTLMVRIMKTCLA